MNAPALAGRGLHLFAFVVDPLDRPMWGEYLNPHNE
jgi:hypothetical protein